MLAQISRTPYPEHSIGRVIIGAPLANGEGSVWLTCDDLRPPYEGAILRIDPNNNEVIANIPVGRNPQSIVFAKGSAWVSTYGTVKYSNAHHMLEKIDIHTNKVTDKYRLEGAHWADWPASSGQPGQFAVNNDSLLAVNGGYARHIQVK